MRKVLALASLLAITLTVSHTKGALAGNFNGKRWKVMGSPSYGWQGYTCPAGQTVGYTYRTWRVGRIISGTWIYPSEGWFVYCFEEQAEATPAPKR